MTFIFMLKAGMLVTSWVGKHSRGTCILYLCLKIRVLLVLLGKSPVLLRSLPLYLCQVTIETHINSFLTTIKNSTANEHIAAAASSVGEATATAADLAGQVGIDGTAGGGVTVGGYTN